jgi:ATP-dependent RNA helicase DDX5/DBP2
MWSATWPKEVQALAYSFLHDFVKIKIGQKELSASANVKQIVEVLEESDKNSR